MLAFLLMDKQVLEKHTRKNKILLFITIECKEIIALKSIIMINYRGLMPRVFD